MNLAAIEAVLAAEAEGRAAVMLTRLTDGAEALLIGETVNEGSLPLTKELHRVADDAASSGRSGVVETADGPVFAHVFSPPARLIVVGAVHIAEPLARIAILAGWRVIIIDPRPAWAERQRFNGCTIVGDWPDTALPALRPDRHTAIVTLTHDPKLDDPALIAALGSAAFYVGALGSRRTHAARRARLAAAGVTEQAISRVHAPVGLAIGALTPAEIAIAILAEITAVRRGAFERGAAGPGAAR